MSARPPGRSPRRSLGRLRPGKVGLFHHLVDTPRKQVSVPAAAGLPPAAPAPARAHQAAFFSAFGPPQAPPSLAGTRASEGPGLLLGTDPASSRASARCGAWRVSRCVV